MNNKQTYTVAGHSFCFVNEQDDPMWERMAAQYEPFADDRAQEILFTLTVSDALPEGDHARLVYKDPKSNPLDAKVDVFRTDGGHLFELTPHGGSEQHSLLHFTDDLRQGTLLLPKIDSAADRLPHTNSADSAADRLPQTDSASSADRFCAINTALMLCYLLATVRRDTALMHASAVVNGGKAYLFLGRSGTGKSTHSNLWLQHISRCELLNDDHPIIRIDTKGQAIAYGSPWSGKTPCYRNQSAPVGGIVRIKQAPRNRIRSLSPIEAYASLTTSCSGMSWDGEMADGKDRTLQGVIAATACYTLECLPNREAAELCAQTVGKEEAWSE